MSGKGKHFAVSPAARGNGAHGPRPRSSEAGARSGEAGGARNEGARNGGARLLPALSPCRSRLSGDQEPPGSRSCPYAVVKGADARKVVHRQLEPSGPWGRGSVHRPRTRMSPGPGPHACLWGRPFSYFSAKRRGDSGAESCRPQAEARTRATHAGTPASGERWGRPGCFPSPSSRLSLGPVGSAVGCGGGFEGRVIAHE